MVGILHAPWLPFASLVCRRSAISTVAGTIRISNVCDLLDLYGHLLDANLWAAAERIGDTSRTSSGLSDVEAGAGGDETGA